MKILMAHSHYRLPGGEETVFEREADLLRSRGHQVVEYRRYNSELSDLRLWDKLTFPKRLLWSSEAARDIRRLIRQERPDVVHFHNTHYMISPSAYYACRELGVPSVQSLDNPRLLCPASTFFRNDTVCQDCFKKVFAWPGVWHRCYRDSRIQTLGVAATTTFHRLVGTWTRVVDCYLASTEFYRQLFIEGGLPASRIKVKQHFVAPDPGARNEAIGQYALYVGRLAPEKGIHTLLAAWQRLDIPLKIRGSGQLLPFVQQAIKHTDSLELIERLSVPELYALMKGARFLVWPSEGLYETFGLVAVEAFACGIPVVGSNLGVMAEIVTDGVTGLHFNAGDPESLAERVEWAWAHPDEMLTLGRSAREEYERKYTAERNGELLEEIYERLADSNS